MNLVEHLDLEQKLEFFLPKVCLEKIEKPLFLFGFAPMWALFFPAILKQSSLLFPVKTFGLQNMAIFETSENIWTKGVNPLWTKALFIIIIFPWSLCNPAPKPKHCHLVTLLASPQEMFVVNHRCHSSRECYNQCTWCLVQVWVFLSMFLGWARPEILSRFWLQQIRAPLCVAVVCGLFKRYKQSLVVTPVSQYWCCSALKLQHCSDTIKPSFSPTGSTSA